MQPASKRPAEDDVLTVTEVAEWLRLSAEAVRRLHRRGRLKRLAGSGKLLFTRASVLRFIDE